MRLFDVSRFKVFVARLHSAMVGPDRPVPPAAISFRIPPNKAAELTAFIDRPEFIQVHAHKKDKFGQGGEPLVELLLPRERLYRKYKQQVAVEQQVSRSNFLKFVNCSSIRMLACKSCLCGPCEEYGHDTFSSLEELVKELAMPTNVDASAVIDYDAMRKFNLQLEQLKDYLRHDFRGKCCDSSTVSTLCIRCRPLNSSHPTLLHN